MRPPTPAGSIQTKVPPSQGKTILVGHVLLLILRYWRTMPVRVGLTFALVWATALSNMAVPWAASRLPGIVAKAHGVTRELAWGAAQMIGLYAAAISFGFLNSFMGVVFRAAILDRLMLDIFRAMVALPSHWLENQAPSAMAQTAYRASRGYLLVDYFVLQVAGPATAFLLCVVVTVGARWPRIGVGLAVLVALYAVAAVLYARNWLTSRVKLVIQRETEAAAAMGDSLTGIGVIKDFSREASEVDRIERIAAARGTAYRNWQRWDASAVGLEALLLIAVFAVLTVGLMTEYWSGRASAPDLIFSVTAFSLVVTHATTLASGFRGMINGAGDVSEGIDYMKKAEAANAGAPVRTAIPRRADGLEIELEDVSFSYEGAERPVLSCVNMHIHTGEIVAIVGPSGVGKSTLARILQARNRPQTGILKLNGMIQGEGDFADGINPVAMVAQEPTMFHRTIWDNIVLGEDGFDRADVERAASLAGIHNFICGLKDGYQTVVGERGMTLSGGQRQRIAIARVFLRNAPCLVLDEPTSAVDLQTEAQLIASIRQHGKDRTIVIISHRPSTIRMARRIFLLGEGRVLDSGTHEELAARSPMYAALCDGESATA
jgi:ATP-binding cassette, subfamily B, bacterial